MRYKFFFIFLLFFTFAFSQEKSQESPRLVVGIKIDGLQASHLHKMWKYLTPGGFRKILSESMVVERMQHNIVSAGNAADAATYMTGTYPYYHGVSGDFYFSRADNEAISILYDKNQTGIGTKNKFSAHRLLTSTFTDELMLNNSLSQVHSIAIRAEDAIMMGGHTATSVSWIDDITNRWITTAYYPKGLSRWADLMNVNGTFKELISEKWTPSASISTYLNQTVKGSKTVPFSYNPTDRREGNSARTILANTAAANSLVTELAKTIVEKEQLGADPHTDVLMLQYTVKIQNQIASSLHYAEQEDMYIRLDRNIQSLLYELSSKIGADKLYVFVVGSGSDVHSPELLGKNQIPAGLFNADKSLALLNTYLMAIYGQEKWISGYYGKNIFLNKRKIEDKNLNLSDFTKRITEFLVEFEGVQAAYTSAEILQFSGENSDARMKIRNSTNKNTSGDIMIELMPGWIEVDNKGNVVGDANNPVVNVPFYLMGKGIKPHQVTEIYSTTDIAPTISSLMDIPFPNACTGRQIIPIEQ